MNTAELRDHIRDVLAWPDSPAQIEVLEVLIRHADAVIASHGPIRLTDPAELVERIMYALGPGDDRTE
jgi:hypothetical protein